MKYFCLLAILLTLLGCAKSVDKEDLEKDLGSVQNEEKQDKSSLVTVIQQESQKTTSKIGDLTTSINDLVVAIKEEQEAERRAEEELSEALTALANKPLLDPGAPPAALEHPVPRGSIGITKNGIIRLDLTRIESLDQALEDADSLRKITERLGLTADPETVEALRKEVEELKIKVEERKRSTIIVNPKEEIAPLPAGPAIIDPAGAMGATYYKEGYNVSGGGYVYGRRPRTFHDHYRSPGSNVTYLKEWEIRRRTNPVSFGRYHNVGY